MIAVLFRGLWLSATLWSAGEAWAQGRREVAVTFDDMPAARLPSSTYAGEPAVPDWIDRRARP